MERLGIVQGRLTPSKGRGIQFFPYENWSQEFAAARKLGITNIEWVFDFEEYEKNPLWTQGGCEKICESIDASGVSVETVCFDYFMRRPFYKSKADLRGENLQVLLKIAHNLARIGGHNIEIPLVDGASIASAVERKAAAEFLHEASECVPEGVHLVLESDLTMSSFGGLLDEIAGRNVSVNYDLGDRLGCGYPIGEEIRFFRSRIGNVHIKDKKFRGKTVPLGEGDADMDEFFSSLKDVGYYGNLTLQAARGADGEETEYVRSQIQMIHFFYEKYFGKGFYGMTAENDQHDVHNKKMIVAGGGTARSACGIPSIGIMQGRLTPSRGRGIQFFPFEEWENEFFLGKDIGIDEIEWIFDYDRYTENPLWTEAGCQTIKERIESTGVKVNSVCFDYFMRRPFFKGKGSREENMEYFSSVLYGMEKIGASLIEVPLVDDSSIKNGKERDEALELARDMADQAAPKHIVVGFETDMPPGIFRAFLEDIGRENVAANYDSGNSSGLGYDHREELLSLGSFVANVHIKDRVFQNGTVQLGTGSADFDQVFSSLKDIGYHGGFILQAARGMDGDEKATIFSQIKFVEKYIEKYYAA